MAKTIFKFKVVILFFYFFPFKLVALSVKSKCNYLFIFHFILFHPSFSTRYRGSVDLAGNSIIELLKLWKLILQRPTNTMRPRLKILHLTLSFSHNILCIQVQTEQWNWEWLNSTMKIFMKSNHSNQHFHIHLFSFYSVFSKIHMELIQTNFSIFPALYFRFLLRDMQTKIVQKCDRVQILF